MVNAPEGGRFQRSRTAWAVLVAAAAFAVAGVAGLEFGHEGPVLVAIAWLIGFLGLVLTRAGWASARRRRRLAGRFPLPGVAEVCGALLLVAAIELISSSWGGDGVITDAEFAKVHIGETKAAVHRALGKPFQYEPTKDGPGEDCDVYEKDPGLQGGMYAHVCYVNDKVIRIVPFV